MMNKSDGGTDFNNVNDRTWEERLLESERRKQEEAEELKVDNFFSMQKVISVDYKNATFAYFHCQRHFGGVALNLEVFSHFVCS